MRSFQELKFKNKQGFVTKVPVPLDVYKRVRRVSARKLRALRPEIDVKHGFHYLIPFDDSFEPGMVDVRVVWFDESVNFGSVNFEPPLSMDEEIFNRLPKLYRGKYPSRRDVKSCTDLRFWLLEPSDRRSFQALAGIVKNLKKGILGIDELRRTNEIR